jgi:hypothetical protein
MQVFTQVMVPLTSKGVLQQGTTQAIGEHASSYYVTYMCIPQNFGKFFTEGTFYCLIKSNYK